MAFTSDIAKINKDYLKRKGKKDEKIVGMYHKLDLIDPIVVLENGEHIKTNWGH